jgi:hypothetical protein
MCVDGRCLVAASFRRWPRRSARRSQRPSDRSVRRRCAAHRCLASARSATVAFRSGPGSARSWPRVRLALGQLPRCVKELGAGEFTPLVAANQVLLISLYVNSFERVVGRRRGDGRVDLALLVDLHGARLGDAGAVRFLRSPHGPMTWVYQAECCEVIADFGFGWDQSGSPRAVSRDAESPEQVWVVGKGRLSMGGCERHNHGVVEPSSGQRRRRQCATRRGGLGPRRAARSAG